MNRSYHISILGNRLSNNTHFLKIGSQTKKNHKKQIKSSFFGLFWGTEDIEKIDFVFIIPSKTDFSGTPINELQIFLLLLYLLSEEFEKFQNIYPR